MFLFCFFLMIGLIGCEKTTKIKQPKDLYNLGRVTYNTQCIACHNRDPKKSGPLGPAVFKSSQLLLEHRVVEGDYPKGYKPKRNTKVMKALPHLKNKIKPLYYYLNDIRDTQ